MKNFLRKTILAVTLSVIPTTYADVAVIDQTLIDEFKADIGEDGSVADAGSVRANQEEQWQQFRSNVDTTGPHHDSPALDEGSLRLDEGELIYQVGIKNRFSDSKYSNQYKTLSTGGERAETGKLYRDDFKADAGSVRKNQAEQIQMFSNYDLETVGVANDRRKVVANTDITTLANKQQLGNWAFGADKQDQTKVKNNLGATTTSNFWYRNYLNTKKDDANAYTLGNLPKDFVPTAACVNAAGGVDTTSAGCKGFNPINTGTDKGADLSAFTNLKTSAEIRKDLMVRLGGTNPTNITDLIAQESEQNARTLAVYHAMFEEAYAQASIRFQNLQILLNAINAANEPKDILDLQARIQAEQMMLQNEQIKLSALGQLRDSQKNMYEQRKLELSNYRRDPQDNRAADATTIAKEALVKGQKTILAAGSVAANTVLLGLMGTVGCKEGDAGGNC